ncbi:hypothetical protein [Leptospira adleri]|uniref:Uncharacterized protein n=1 Tax=Leptospira adleri TaxID=2023186 RepID=A0A2M9YJ94_9LEPT|nr:hypothetical protein [Leptospira adleri]PJZ51607.1 hypothetical protein CH380_19365 [Leptospira adleri]PJZ61884.1 hypothetical protein CH376_10800 [Leptospira adleri]
MEIIGELLESDVDEKSKLEGYVTLNVLMGHSIRTDSLSPDQGNYIKIIARSLLEGLFLAENKLENEMLESDVSDHLRKKIRYGKPLSRFLI